MAFCLINDVYTLVSYLTITALMSTTFSVAALIFIKWKEVPVSPNAVQFHIFWPILNLVVNIVLLVTPIVAEPVKSGIGFGLFLLGIGCYYVFMTREMFVVLKKIDALIAYCCQLLFWTVVDTAPLLKDDVKANVNSVAEGGTPATERRKSIYSIHGSIVSDQSSNGHLKNDT
ncbi:unnamed protein product [Nippostrongylus brasiliensis]|uniref:AA_permease_C domain-containing protein n=1 Tax=Nippostrongylus brasiliensis TaxID=27835 RepID=A0A0N4Y4I7_NIPBR|nr:unnamed protein product [Nippostrongylus brasiliensis]